MQYTSLCLCVRVVLCLVLLRWWASAASCCRGSDQRLGGGPREGGRDFVALSELSPFKSINKQAHCSLSAVAVSCVSVDMIICKSTGSTTDPAQSSWMGTACGLPPWSLHQVAILVAFWAAILLMQFSMILWKYSFFYPFLGTPDEFCVQFDCFVMYMPTQVHVRLIAAWKSSPSWSYSG